jgi:NAD(P)H dehydrogenase (quinone)
MQQKALIVAANGRVASRVLARLSGAGPRPNALVRDGDKARTVLTDRHGFPLYEELIIAELADSYSLESALTEVDIAFLALGSGPDQIDLEKAVIDAAKAVSLPHLVKLSAANASHDAVTSVPPGGAVRIF